MTKQCVIFDLDGTLADVRHRLHHLRGGKPDWPAFFDACVGDPPRPAIVRLAQLLHDPDEEHLIVITTGRPDTYRAVTEEWLDLQDVPWYRMTMRKAGDYRPDVVVKREMLETLRAEGYEPILAVDDRPSVVRMWREEGIECLAVDPRDWEDAEVSYAGDVEGQTLLTILVGPPGSGKSAWARGPGAKVFGIWPNHVLTADHVRNDLPDSASAKRVFAALHDLARARLRHGLPTVLDATHLRRRDRLEAAKLAPTGTRVRYAVLERPEALRIHDADALFQSELPSILAGDGLPNVDVVDLR